MTALILVPNSHPNDWGGSGFHKVYIGVPILEYTRVTRDGWPMLARWSWITDAWTVDVDTTKRARSSK